MKDLTLDRLPAELVDRLWMALALGAVCMASVRGMGLLAGGGLLAGIGFTMALFIGDLALPDALIDSAKLGILSASAVCAVAGLAAAAMADVQNARDRRVSAAYAPPHRPVR